MIAFMKGFFRRKDIVYVPKHLLRQEPFALTRIISFGDL